MSLPSLRTPLDLPVRIAETRRAEGAHGVVDLLVATLVGGRLRKDDIDGLLGHLKAACRQTRRYREALPVLHRIAALQPDRRDEMTAEIALVHWHLGERAVAVATLEAAVAQQYSRPAWQRSLTFCVVAEVAAAVVNRSDLAAACVQLGRSSVTPAPRRARSASPTRAAEIRTNDIRTNEIRTNETRTNETRTNETRTKEKAAAAAPRVGRPRVKGPVRQLSVLGAADQPNLSDAGARPRLTVVGGTAA